MTEMYSPPGLLWGCLGNNWKQSQGTALGGSASGRGGEGVTRQEAEDFFEGDSNGSDQEIRRWGGVTLLPGVREHESGERYLRDSKLGSTTTSAWLSARDQEDLDLMRSRLGLQTTPALSTFSSQQLMLESKSHNEEERDEEQVWFLEESILHLRLRVPPSPP